MGAACEEVCVFYCADSTAGQTLAKRPVATSSTTPYRAVLSPRLCSTPTPASRSDMSRVKVQTSNTHTVANKWHLSVTSGQHNTASARFLTHTHTHTSATIILHEKLPCEIMTWNHPSKANKAEAKALQGRNLLSVSYQLMKKNYMAATLKHLISSLCTIMLHHISSTTSLQLT